MTDTTPTEGDATGTDTGGTDTTGTDTTGTDTKVTHGAPAGTATVEFDVEGGVVVAHDLTPEAPDGAVCVIAIHGITANALSWRRVAGAVTRRVPDPVRVLALDLRGRACSRHLGPPYGLGAQADDVLTVASTLPGRPVLLGHSMGASVGALAAARSPGVVAGAVLVDGGLALPPAEGADVHATLTAIMGPAMKRLSMTFRDEAAYLGFWSEHPAVGPALAGPAGEALRDYLLHDLVRSADGDLVSGCVLDAVRADGADMLADPETLGAVAAAVASGVPIEFLWAERGLLDQPEGQYDERRIAALDVPEAVRVTRVPDVNHYSVVLDERGVTAVVDAVERVLEAPGSGGGLR